MDPKMGWADRPGPILAHLVPPSSVMLLVSSESALLCMWALDVSFSAILDRATCLASFSIFCHILKVFCLHGLVLGLPGVMFTSLLDLSRASWLLMVQNHAQVHRKPTGDLVPFSPRRVLPRFVNPRIGSKLPGFSI
jgi:hypothetical protein